MPPRHPPYPYVEPVLVNPSQDDIDATIEDFLSQNPGLDIQEGGPLDSVCRALNVDVEYSYEPNEILLDVPLDKKPVFWLPRNSKTKQDRVTLATGIGIWLMHVPPTREAHPKCGIQALYKPSAPALMQEALRFAYSLLMPALAFKSLWYEGGGKHTAEALNVPTRLVYERAKTLVLDDEHTPIAPKRDDPEDTHPHLR